jgi:hypothetical protein
MNAGAIRADFATSASIGGMPRPDRAADGFGLGDVQINGNARCSAEESNGFDTPA